VHLAGPEGEPGANGLEAGEGGDGAVGDIRKAYVAWTKAYHYPDGPTVSYLDAFKAGVEYARRTPPPATKVLIDAMRSKAKFRWQEFTFLRADVLAMLAEWPEPAKEPAHE
jgi:hypothetical protein